MANSDNEHDEESSDSSSTTSSGAEHDWPVSEEWLETVLREQHRNLPDSISITVLDFNVTPIHETAENSLSDVLAVVVTYCLKNDPTNYGHSLNFIAKVPPRDPFSRFFVTQAEFDLREIKFYTEILPDLEKFQAENLPKDKTIALPTPKCYYAHYTPGTKQPKFTLPESVLVLENIANKDYIESDFSLGLTLRQATAAMEAIAQVHSLSLSFKIKEKKSLTETYGFLFQTDKASDSYQRLVERGLPQLTQFLEKQPGLADILAALNALRPRTKEVIEALLKPTEPMALIAHTDFWCNNLMFKEDESTCECSILDWQMVTYSRPTNDLALLIVSSVPAELRRLHTDKLLDVYWNVFKANCLKFKIDVEQTLGYTRKDLDEDYKNSQLLALLLCIGSVDLAIGDAQMEERLLELLKDLHKDGLLSPDVGGGKAQK